MARPTRLTVDNGTNAWDAKFNSNFQNLYDRPLPVALHTGDETDLQTTFPAAQYDKCLIWVDHTTDGWLLYYSNGTSWAKFAPGNPGFVEIESITGTDTIQNTTQLAVCSGTSYTVTLPDASDVGEGWVLTIKRTSSGTITLDGAGADTIDSAGTFALDPTLAAVTLVSNGVSNWHIV